jgi:hypothetical protein
MMTGMELEEFYKSRLKGRFPYEDCRWVADHGRIRDSDFIPELGTYFADIVGFSSSASRLRNRPIGQLQRAITILSKDFFERHPPLARIKGLITHGQTPDLYAKIQSTEEARSVLLDILRAFEIE